MPQSAAFSTNAEETGSGHWAPLLVYEGHASKCRRVYNSPRTRPYAHHSPAHDSVGQIEGVINWNAIDAARIVIGAGFSGPLSKSTRRPGNERTR